MADFWRLPGPQGILETSEEEVEEEKPVAAGAERPAAAAPAVGSGLRSSRSQDLRALVLPGPSVPQLAAPPVWVQGAPCAAPPPDLEAMFRLVAVGDTTYPVRVGSLAYYLVSLRPEGEGGVAEAPPLAGPDPSRASGAQSWLVERLAQDCSPEDFSSVPLELRGGSHLRPAPRASRGAAEGWLSLRRGAEAPPEPLLCGALAPVSQLPNPFTVVTDVPLLVEQMLAKLPREEWDMKRLGVPTPVEGFPGLCRGPGGVLPAQTPRQLAHNWIAAALLNRLCANLHGAAARRRAASAAPGRAAEPSAEERAAAEAERQVAAVTRALQQAHEEEAVACRALREFQSRMESNAERQRELQCTVGWKSSARAQTEAELLEANRELQAARRAVERSRAQGRQVPWHERWPSLVPPEALSQPLFGVRLTAKGQAAHTIRDFVEAMQSGLIDRSGHGFVPKHSLEAAFVRSALDGLLLCSRKGDAPEAVETYTHLPAPATVGTGVVTPGAGVEMRTVRPHHAFLLRLEGATFPFTVTFGAVGSRGASFVGLGTTAATCSLPWNPLEYGDILWATEAQESFDLVSAIAAVAALVADEDLCLGLFPPLQEGVGGEVPLGTAAVALLQAALFHDVKMWPVCLPEAARLRWEFALRALWRALGLREPDGSEAADGDGSLAALRDEALPRLLAALPKVPCDGPSGGAAPGGCRAVTDRLKRMELSLLTQLPFYGVDAFKELLAEIMGLWPKFEEDTQAAL